MVGGGGVLNIINTPYLNEWQVKYIEISGMSIQSDKEVLRLLSHLVPCQSLITPSTSHSVQNQLISLVASLSDVLTIP
jgi:hypothetical protein